MCMLSVFMCFIKILFSSLNTMLIVDKHCSDVCCDEFPVPQIDRKNKQVKEQWHGKFYLQSVIGKLAILNTENIEICGWITNIEAIKMQFVCISSICAEYLQKISIYNFPRYSVATCVRWGGNVVGFCSKFHTISNSAKFWKWVNIWQSYREFKGGNFFWDTVYTHIGIRIGQRMVKRSDTRLSNNCIYRRLFCTAAEH